MVISHIDNCGTDNFVLQAEQLRKSEYVAEPGSMYVPERNRVHTIFAGSIVQQVQSSLHVHDRCCIASNQANLVAGVGIKNLAHHVCSVPCKGIVCKYMEAACLACEGQVLQICMLCHYSLCFLLFKIILHYIHPPAADPLFKPARGVCRTHAMRCNLVPGVFTACD